MTCSTRLHFFVTHSANDQGPIPITLTHTFTHHCITHTHLTPSHIIVLRTHSSPILRSQAALDFIVAVGAVAERMGHHPDVHITGYRCEKAMRVASRTSHVTRHTSHVTRHTSHVTRHTSHVTRHGLHPQIRSLCHAHIFVEAHAWSHW